VERRGEERSGEERSGAEWSGVEWSGVECSGAFLRSVRRLLLIANVVPSSPILVTLMMEAIRCLE
jgi:hypothetical protein